MSQNSPSVQAVILTGGKCGSTTTATACRSGLKPVVVGHNLEDDSLLIDAERIVQLYTDEFTVGCSLNLATSSTWCDWLLFLHDDADCLSLEQCCEMIEAAQRLDIPLVAPTIDGVSPSRHQKLLTLSGYSTTPTYLSDSCFLVEKRSLLNVGGFPNTKLISLIGLQWKFWRRFRRRALLCHDIVVKHQGNRTWQHYYADYRQVELRSNDFLHLSAELNLRVESSIRFGEPSVTDKNKQTNRVTRVDGGFFIQVDDNRREFLVDTGSSSLNDELLSGLSTSNSYQLDDVVKVNIKAGDKWTTEVKTINLLITPPLGLGDIVFILKGVAAVQQEKPGYEFVAYTPNNDWGDLLKLTPYFKAVHVVDKSHAPSDSIHAHNFGFAYEGTTTRLASFFGVDYEPTDVEFAESDVTLINDTLHSLGLSSSKLVGLQAHGNWPNKRWSHFRAMHKRLINEGFQVLTFGHNLSDDERCENQVQLGIVNLGTLIGVLRVLKGLVGFDSGVIHLASVLGVPSVSLWGPLDPKWFLFDTRPKNTVAIRKRVPQLHCGGGHCRDEGKWGNICPFRGGKTGGDCLDDISVEEVWQQLNQVMKNVV